MPLNQMMEKAKLDINWPFSLRSLMYVRPPWILLPKSCYILGCLCEICQNTSLLLRLISFTLKMLTCVKCNKCRAIYQFILWVKQHGSAPDKIAVLTFEFTPSVSSFLDLVLHPKVNSDFVGFLSKISTFRWRGNHSITTVATAKNALLNLGSVDRADLANFSPTFCPDWDRKGWSILSMSSKPMRKVMEPRYLC